MILPIYVYGQPVLRKVAEDITPDYPNLKELIENMFETMVHADGVGLAAPQIGLPIRVVTITLDPLSEEYPEFKDFNKAYINPHILEVGGVLAIYLRDFGVQLGYAMDTLAMDVVINGNKPDGSESAPVIGVYETTNGITYKDLLHIWVRAARMGRNFTTMIGGEDQAIEMLNLPEFKERHSGTTEATLNVKSPVPKNANFYIHPGTPDQGLLLIDTTAALIKLTAKQLMLESERIVSNQTQAIYATLTTGFSKMYQDAALILSAEKKFSEFGFPEFMNIDPYLLVNLE